MLIFEYINPNFQSRMICASCLPELALSLGEILYSESLRTTTLLVDSSRAMLLEVYS